MIFKTKVNILSIKRFVIMLMCELLSLFLIFTVAGQELANDTVVPLNQEEKRFEARHLIVPAALVVAGALGVGDGWLKGVKHSTREMMVDLSGGRKFQADDYIQYLPVAVDMGLNLTHSGIHPKRDRWLITATACALTAIMVNGLKWGVNELRPDGSAFNSFPSGHTATAFMGAELVRMEYGNAWGLGAYSIASAVGVLRMYNNRHWLNDVIAGAGIGILAARVALWLLPLERKLLRWSHRQSGPSICVIPVASARNVGFSIAASF